MNALFEAYVLRQLRRLPGVHVRAQAKKVFWRSAGAGTKTLKPDLVVTVEGRAVPLIIDTKWKVPEGSRPGDDDLRQLFAYLKAFAAGKGLLLYPRAVSSQISVGGTYSVDGLEGGVGFLDLFRDGAPSSAGVRESLRDLLAEMVLDRTSQDRRTRTRTLEPAHP